MYSCLMNQLLEHYGLYYVAATDCGEIGITSEEIKTNLSDFRWIYWWKHNEI